MLSRFCHNQVQYQIFACAKNCKSQWQCWNIDRWSHMMCEVWDLWEKGGQKDETQQAMSCLFPKPSDGDSLHYHIYFWCFRFSIMKSTTKQNKKNLVNHFFFIVFGRPIIFHLTTALNCYQSSTTLPPFCQHSLRILTQSQSLNWQWHGLLATAPKQLVKKLTNQGQLAAFKKRAVVFKRCLLPCILKQHLKDCLQGAGRAQGRRALNQVINSD